ncbi:adhesion G-protein coupled receptor F1-like isoform X2 [Rhinoderma darwinii]|uniref:adhesion G-protein coupled receptor F1-like isoform X2 n=1 Tax=Rhinoderma darwinii TaxID=43563 RepID=UPI003F664CB1
MPPNALHAGGFLCLSRKYHRRTFQSSLFFGMCTFPFTFNGNVHYQCTNDGGTHFYWCGHSYNVDTDLLWGFCSGPGNLGISDCYAAPSSNSSNALCLIRPTDAIGLSLASIHCTVPGTYYNAYIEAFCDAPSSMVPTASNSTTTSTNNMISSSPANVSSMTLTTTSPSTTVSSIISTSTPSSPTNASSITSTTTSPSTTVSSMTSTSTTTPSSSTTVSSMTSTTSPSTTVSSMTSTSTTTPSSSTTVSSMTSTTSPSTTASSMTSTTTTTPSSPTTVSSMTSTTSPSTTVSSMTSTSTTTPSSPTTVSSMTSTSTTTPSSPITVSSMTSTTDTRPAVGTGITLDATPSPSPVLTKGSSGAGPSSTAENSLQISMEQISQSLLSSAGGSVLQSLWSFITVASAGFQQNDLPLVLSVLGNITRNVQLRNLCLDVDTVKKVLVIADQLMETISSEPSISMEKNLGPQLLMCLENLLSVMTTTEHSFSLFFRHFDLHCSVSPCDSLEDNGFMSLDLGTTISLSSEDTDDHSRCLVNMLSMTYRAQGGSFSSQYDCNGDPVCSYSLVSNIQTYVLRLNNITHHVADINMTFTCWNRTCDKTAICVFWDFNLNKWSSKGCHTQVIDGATNCSCHHLTSFSILMSGSHIVNTPALDYITKTGLTASIVSLLLCISIQVILLRSTRNRMASHRHVAILHLSIFLLLSHASFLASSFIEPNVQEKLCVALTFCTHLFLLCYFGWTLVQGTFLVHCLVFVLHHVTMTEFMVLSVVLGYVCPLAVAVATFVAYYPHNYRRNDECWLDNNSGALMAFTIPAIVIVSLNVLVLIVVIRKLLRPSISEGKGEDEEVVKKVAKAVLICTPQFGLTWAIGIPLLMNENAECLHYLFDLLNPLQGVFVLLFGCLLDKKVIDLVKKYFLQKSSASSLASVVSSSG